MTSSQLIKNYNTGKQGEYITSRYLEEHGYKIIATRFRHIGGEIDILATKNNILCAVEVKSSKSIHAALNALSHTQYERMAHIIEIFLQQNPTYIEYDIRFDAAIVIHNKIAEYIENVSI